MHMSLLKFESKIENWETDKCPKWVVNALADFAKHISSELVFLDWALLRQINVY